MNSEEVYHSIRALHEKIDDLTVEVAKSCKWQETAGCNDHETRLRALEKAHWRILAIWGVVFALATLLKDKVADFLVKGCFPWGH